MPKVDKEDFATMKLIVSTALAHALIGKLPDVATRPDAAVLAEGVPTAALGWADELLKGCGLEPETER